jgi:hypothetical protein
LTQKQKEARRKAQRELYKKSSSSSSSSAIPVEEEDAHHHYYSSADEGLQTNDDERELPISVFAKNQEELPSDDDDRELPHNVFAKKNEPSEAELKQIEYLNAEIKKVRANMKRSRTDTTRLKWQNILKGHEEELAALQTGSGDDASKGLSNVEIDNIMGKYSEYLGTISHNEIPKLIDKIRPKSKGCFIINTDPVSKGGQHWQCVYFDATPGGESEIDFFDSFGDPADDKILHGIKLIANKIEPTTYLKYKENMIKKQDDKSTNCGFFCMNFLISRLNGKRFQNASGFDDHMNGEHDIEKFKKQMGYGNFRYVHGAGFIDYIKEKANSIVGPVVDYAKDTLDALWNGRTKPPPAVRDLLTKHGQSTIVTINIYRSPIIPAIKHVLNLLSRGQLQENQNSLAYDQIYHLYMILELDDGYRFKLEKNETVMVDSPNINANSELMNVPISDSIKLVDFISNGTKSDGSWDYNALTKNCQIFVRDLLAGSNLLSGPINSFVLQDGAKLMENMPLTQKLAKRITDIGGRLHILIHGVGQRMRKKKGKGNTCCSNNNNLTQVVPEGGNPDVHVDVPEGPDRYRRSIAANMNNHLAHPYANAARQWKRNAEHGNWVNPISTINNVWQGQKGRNKYDLNSDDEKEPGNTPIRPIRHVARAAAEPDEINASPVPGAHQVQQQAENIIHDEVPPELVQIVQYGPWDINLDIRHIRGLTTGEFLIEVAEDLKRNGLTYMAIIGILSSILEAYYGNYHMVIAILTLLLGAFNIAAIRSLLR